VSAVRAAYGPTLPELLGARRWRVVRAIAIVVAVVIAAYVLLVRPNAVTEHVVVGRGALQFNYVYDAPLRPVGPAKVEQRNGDVFVQSLDVEPFAMPPYRGDIGGTLPIVADRLEARLAARHPGFQVVDEGRARINTSPGYYVAWQADLGSRRLFGRDYLLVDGSVTAPRGGAHLSLLSTYAGGVSGPDDVGRIGQLKQPLRSFRFGTARP
jgi:hypothetical protein